MHTVKYGDTSLVAYLLTDIHGRQTYMVQGVKSSKGKGNKASVLQPMFPLEFEGFQTRHSQMHRMKDVRLAFPLQTVPFDVRKSTISLFMAESLYKLIKETEPNATLFDFVRNSVIALDLMTDGVANFHLWFLVRLSAFLGFYPANDRSEGEWFDITDGSFKPLPPQHGVVMNRRAGNLLGEFMDAGVGVIGGIKLTREERRDFLEQLLRYFGYHLEAVDKIQSIQILREVF